MTERLSEWEACKPPCDGTIYPDPDIEDPIAWLLVGYVATVCNALPTLLTEVRELRQQLADSQAQVAVLTDELRNIAEWLRVEAADMDCDAGNFDGGSPDTCPHCLTRHAVEDIDKLLANLSTLATALLSERERMRTALDDIADSTTGGNSLIERLDWCRQRARDARQPREEVML